MTDRNLQDALLELLDLITQALYPRRPTKETTESYTKLIRTLKETYPEAVAAYMEKNKMLWYDIIENPETLLNENPDKFLQGVVNYSSVISVETVLLWSQTHPEHFENFLNNTFPLYEDNVAAVWAATLPESFLQACDKHPGAALPYQFENWKKLKAERGENTERLTASIPVDTILINIHMGAVALAWLQDDTERFEEHFLQNTEGLKGFKNTLHRVNQLKDQPQEEDLPQGLASLSSKVLEAWWELNPQAVTTLANAYPNFMLKNHSELWSKIDPESYVKAARRQPVLAYTNPRLLNKLAPEVLKEEVEQRLAANLGSPQNVDDVNAYLVVDWEKATVFAGSYEKLYDSGDEWVKREPEALLAYVTAGAAHELSTREIDKALTLLRGQSEKNFNEGMWAAATRADLGSPQVDKLDQWRKTNPQDWARGGAFIFYKLIYKLEEGYERGSYGYGREEELAQLLDIIEHYKTHNEQLTKELLRAEGGKQHEPLEPRLTLEPGFKEENEMNVEPWLPLSEIIFDTEQANQLAASVLATPGMGVASTAWATLRAGNLTSTQSTPRIPKRRKVESLGR